MNKFLLACCLSVFWAFPAVLHAQPAAKADTLTFIYLDNSQSNAQKLLDQLCFDATEIRKRRNPRVMVWRTDLPKGEFMNFPLREEECAWLNYHRMHPANRMKGQESADKAVLRAKLYSEAGRMLQEARAAKIPANELYLEARFYLSDRAMTDMAGSRKPLVELTEEVAGFYGLIPSVTFIFPNADGKLNELGDADLAQKRLGLIRGADATNLNLSFYFFPL